MKYPISKYQFYVHTNSKGSKEVIAVSTYAGKAVRAKAQCDPRDNYEIETGKKLAAARCNVRISEKRKKRAAKLLAKAEAQMIEAKRFKHKMLSYYTDATDELAAAVNELRDIENSLID